MAISGAFAGLAGAVVSLGVFSSDRVLSVQDGYGFDGIAVAPTVYIQILHKNGGIC
jgi:simple sugar transport system permease protein